MAEILLFNRNFLRRPDALPLSFFSASSQPQYSSRSYLSAGTRSDAALLAASFSFARRPQRSPALKARAVVEEESTSEPKWWEKNAPNMIDIHSTQEFLDTLSQAADKLVIVEFYATWCGSCRALYPKFCKAAEEHPEILFLKVNFDENKPMCRRLNVRVLPYFQFYRGADGLLESFSCSLAKFQRIKDAIEMHSTDRCSIGPPKGVGDLNLQDMDKKTP